VTDARRELVAPHRRGERIRRRRTSTRVLERGVERFAVYAFRAGSWLIGHMPAWLARGLIRSVLVTSYGLWPSKRRTVNSNFSHVLGLPPDDPEVRRQALAAYSTYARYLVELMRMPQLSNDDAAALVDTSNLLPLEAWWRENQRGIILTTAHIGNLEGVARGIARHGWPIAALADDTSFPELFAHLMRQREAWGVKLIPWRNLRDLYGVLRRNEVLTLLVDWGYRADGIPVRLFGSWTTLPAGPAALAAKTGAVIVHIAIRRAPDGRRFLVTYSDRIEVASSAPADLAVASQRIADELEKTIADAPEQWYSFKPLWPDSDAEQADLEQRAATMLAPSTG
jgi:KDO2-lipid IV(A) lauroyltransferase